MNISKVISALQTSLGLYNITLPFKDEKTGEQKPTEQVIEQVIRDVTIPMYSQFVPWERKGTIDVKDLIRPPHEEMGVYWLPAWLTLTDVHYIIDIHLPYHNVRGTYGDIAPAYGINRSMQGVATSKAYMMAASQMRAGPTWEWLGDNKFKLYGWPKTKIEIEVACDHMENLESVPQSCYESFMNLATLDMKVFLWNTLKHYQEIPTAFGTINLKIEDYQTADTDRTALLKEYGDVFHVDIMPFSFM